MIDEMDMTKVSQVEDKPQTSALVSLTSTVDSKNLITGDVNAKSESMVIINIYLTKWVMEKPTQLPDIIGIATVSTI